MSSVQIDAASLTNMARLCENRFSIADRRLGFNVSGCSPGWPLAGCQWPRSVAGRPVAAPVVNVVAIIVGDITHFRCLRSSPH